MSSAVSPYSAKDEAKLMTELWDEALKDDLNQWVKFIYPWGKSGTPLAKFEGPRTWQREELQAITDHIKANKMRDILGELPEVYQSATASGRGVGKSSLTSWLNHWMMSTRLGSTSINSANTETQLKTRTWAELGKWHTLSINAHWFDLAALSLKPATWFQKTLKEQLKIDTGYYYSQAQLWSEENPDAFAGVHNFAGIMVIFDEASGIPAPIWTVTEGFFTEPIMDRYFFAFSNPRRNTGAFYQCFHDHKQYYRRRNLDSRTVEGTDKKVLDRIVEKHGEDSDAARIEVKGQFPRQGDAQFISRDLIESSCDREFDPDPFAPLIIGVDPARYGDDESVIYFRQGRDARSIPCIRMKSVDNMKLANTVADWIEKTNPDAVAIDAGNGTGVIDRLRELKFVVHEVWMGSKSTEPEWANTRTELWDRMRSWLKGGALPDDAELRGELAGPEYRYMGKTDKILLEPKEEMKKRGLKSPNIADALSITFAVKAARRDSKIGRGARSKVRTTQGVDYPVFGGGG